MSTIHVFKTITRGGISKLQLLQYLKDKEIHVSDWATGMMQQDAFTVASEEEQIDLVVVSVADLGFSERTPYDIICQRAREHGLEKCRPGDGPQLRYQYLDQPLGECLTVAHEAIRGSDGDLDIFSVEHAGNGLWLGGGYCGLPDSLWDPDCRFVFHAPQVDS